VNSRGRAVIYRTEMAAGLETDRLVIFGVPAPLAVKCSRRLRTSSALRQDAPKRYLMSRARGGAAAPYRATV
jgi:hypothetical protein